MTSTSKPIRRGIKPIGGLKKLTVAQKTAIRKRNRTGTERLEIAALALVLVGTFLMMISVHLAWALM